MGKWLSSPSSPARGTGPSSPARASPPADAMGQPPRRGHGVKAPQARRERRLQVSSSEFLSRIPKVADELRVDSVEPQPYGPTRCVDARGRQFLNLVGRWRDPEGDCLVAQRLRSGPLPRRRSIGLDLCDHRGDSIESHRGLLESESSGLRQPVRGGVLRCLLR